MWESEEKECMLNKGSLVKQRKLSQTLRAVSWSSSGPGTTATFLQMEISFTKGTIYTWFLGS